MKKPALLRHDSYHLQFSGPCEPHWPEGAWSVYHITGDEIADRVVREHVAKPKDGPAYYEGKIIARHSWCGFIGMFTTLPEVQ